MIKLFRNLFALISLFAIISCNNTEKATIIIKNANILTMDSTLLSAKAFAINKGLFIAVGSNKSIEKYIGDSTQVIDMQGKTIVPGFYDAHMHPRLIFPELHPRGVVNLAPPSVESMDELISALRKKAEVTPEGYWVTGARYSDIKVGRHPTATDLDKVSTTHPVFIRHSSGHVSACNSYALKMAGINKNTPDPAGGKFDRDAKGIPNGVLREGAAHIIHKAGPTLYKLSEQEEVDAFIRCFNNFLAKGITSIGDAGVSPGKYELYKKAFYAGQPVRVNAMMHYRYYDSLANLKTDSTIPETNLRCKTVKLFHGNSLSGRTCWLNEPYDMVNPETGKKDYYGIAPGRSQQTLDSIVARVHNAGLQIAVHSNGDREIPMVLQAIEKALKVAPNINHRHRIEHCSVVNDSILRTIKQLGVVIATHSYVYEHGDKMEAYGEKRWNMMHANKSAIEMGIPVAGNSDYSVSAADPMMRIQSMVTRKHIDGKVYGPKQKITVNQALYVWTMGSAYSFFEEDLKGSISPGKLADFIVLSEDPNVVKPETIKDIIVEKTFIGGHQVYARSL